MKNATKLFTEIQITAKGNNKFRQEHLMQTQNLDPDMNHDRIDMHSEDVDDSHSSHQHRKIVELIKTGDNEETVQNTNKQTKTSLGNRNSKNRRRKKLRKT